MVSIITDTIYTYRFLKLLVTPFDKTEAYKLGIIDENGKRTDKKITSSEERATFTLFHRITFNLKRLLGAFPGGKTRIASYAAALALLREQYGVDYNYALQEMNLDQEYRDEIKTLVEEYDPKKKKKKKEKTEEYGTTTADVATKPMPMKFKAFLKRKKEE